MPYCVSFKEIPDQPEVVMEIIAQIKHRKLQVMQMEALR
jgi:hypothetical protein